MSRTGSQRSAVEGYVPRIPTMQRDKILVLAMLAVVSGAPALAQETYPSRAECAAAFTHAATDARAAVNDGILGGCGIAGTRIIADVVRASAHDVDQNHFTHLRDVAELPVTARRRDRRVYLIRVGDRYVVEDPRLRFGEFGLVLVLDERFAVLARLAQ